MAESEQQHSHQLEQAAVTSTEKTENHAYRALARGQYTGFALSIVCVLAAAGIAAYGAHWLASVALVGIPMLVTVRTLMVGASKK